MLEFGDGGRRGCGVDDFGFQLLLFFAVEVIPGIEVESVVFDRVIRKKRGKALFLWGHPERRSSSTLAFFDDPVLQPLPAA